MKGLSSSFQLPGGEADYLAFLEVRKTPVTTLDLPAKETTKEDAKHITATIRKGLLADRGLHDKAQRSFVSRVKSHIKHQTSSILQITELDWEDLGQAWGLLKLPKLPELKKWQCDKTLGVTVDYASSAYRYHRWWLRNSKKIMRGMSRCRCSGAGQGVDEDAVY